MSESPYDPSDSLISLELTNQNSLDSDEPDSPESSCSLVFRNGEWQMPIDEEDMDYTQFKPKRASSPISSPGNNSSVSFTNSKIFFLFDLRIYYFSQLVTFKNILYR